MFRFKSFGELMSRLSVKRVAVAVFILVAAIVGYQSWRALHISHAVAMHNLACELVRTHVIKHDGQWPKSWSDLEDSMGSDARCDSIRRRIEIDFQANPRELARQSTNELTRFDLSILSCRRIVTIERLNG